MKAIICNKWELPILEGKTGGFFKYLIPSITSRRANAMAWLLSDIPEGLDVIEYFGGVGVQSTIVRNLLKPNRHLIMDIDPECVEQLRFALKDEDVIIELRDSKRYMTSSESKFDVAMMDFGDLTAKKLQDWDEQFSTIFKREPKFVTITDIAYKRLHLHLPLYSRILNYEITDINSYLEAFSKYFLKKYDYSIDKVGIRPGASYIRLSPGSNKIESKLFNIPENGFVLVE